MSVCVCVCARAWVGVYPSEIAVPNLKRGESCCYTNRFDMDMCRHFHSAHNCTSSVIILFMLHLNCRDKRAKQIINYIFLFCVYTYIQDKYLRFLVQQSNMTRYFVCWVRLNGWIFLTQWFPNPSASRTTKLKQVKLLNPTLMGFCFLNNNICGSLHTVNDS